MKTKLIIAVTLTLLATTAQADMSDQEFYQLLEMSDRRQMLNNQQEMIDLQRQAQQQQQQYQQQQLTRGTGFIAPPRYIDSQRKWGFQ
jgi:hypothetical protein